MESQFSKTSDYLFSLLQADEQLVLNWHGEETTFIRFNKSKVRQISDVLQIELSICLKFQKTESTLQIPISGHWAIDEVNLKQALDQLRERVKSLKVLPYYVEVSNHGSSNTKNIKPLPETSEYLDIICQEISDVDLAGILTSGNTSIGNANSLGQQHWFESSSFYFDYSLYLVILNI